MIEATMKKLALLFVAVSLFVASPSFAGSPGTGSSLLQDCIVAIRVLDGDDSADQFQFGMCAGYISGAIENHKLTATNKRERFFCFPQDTDIGLNQVMRITLKYLQNHPEHHHYPAAFSVNKAMQEAFPCK